MQSFHDASLVTLSVIVAILASYTAIDLAGRVHANVGRVRLFWMAGGAFAMGAGIWTMHFVGMLAFRLPVPVSYDASLVALSIAVAMCASGMALWVVGRSDVSRAAHAAAALAMGTAIAGMHYLGMAAMRVPAHLHYDPLRWWLSIAVAIGASFVALDLARRFSGSEPRRSRRLRAGAAVAMGIAIAGMHFTGMAAARFTLDETARAPAAGALPVGLLAVAVAAVGLLIVGLALVAAMVDRLLRARSVEAELRLAMRAAENTSRLKSDFLATMSHEIRTPMSGVLGMLGLALDSDLTPELRSYLGTARSSAESLLVILNDILDFSRIEAGKLELEPIRFDLLATLEEIAEVMALRAHEKQIELMLRVPPSMVARVIGDPGRLRQVLVNLAGNAIKFTARGHVVIEADLISNDRSTARIRFAVQDTGIGIPADRQSQVFEKFTQADSSTTRRYGGTGLGLAISRQLVELMGGRLSLTSVDGEGSTFEFTVPLQIDRDGPPRRLPLAELDGVRVLIVDDIAVNRTILMEQTSSWGMRPLAVAGAAEARRELLDGRGTGDPFRLALLDYLMPDEDGASLARWIRGNSALGPVGLLVVTSSAQSGDAERFAQAGFSAYFSKPVRSAMLMEGLAAVLGVVQEGTVLKSIITRHSLNEGMPRPASTPLAPIVPRGDGQGPPRRALVAEDNAVNQLITRKLLQRAGWTVHTVGDGHAAVLQAATGEYDLILMDCEMPEMDGYEATAAIRLAEGGARHTPIIALTATAMQGDRERCLAAGMDDYVSKPIQVARLMAVLDRWSARDAVGPPGST
jgi:signal transduction histidine kinase/DNA-binding response OmpR family regulator